MRRPSCALIPGTARHAAVPRREGPQRAWQVEPHTAAMECSRRPLVEVADAPSVDSCPGVRHDMGCDQYPAKEVHSDCRVGAERPCWRNHLEGGSRAARELASLRWLSRAGSSTHPAFGSRRVVGFCGRNVRHANGRNQRKTGGLKQVLAVRIPTATTSLPNRAS
jgi:hypothetical protein